MSEPTPPPENVEILTGEIAQRISRETKVYLNVSQETIVITEDKVRLCLTGHLKRIEAKRGWVAPAAILVTILVTLVTAEFHDFYLKAAVWEAIFILALVFDTGWLIFALRSAWKSSTVDEVVAEMKRVGTPHTDSSAESAVIAVAEGRPGWKVVGNWEIQEKETTNWKTAPDWICGKDSGTALWKGRLPIPCRIGFEAQITDNKGSDEIDMIVGDVMVLYYSAGVRLDLMNDDLSRERGKVKSVIAAPQLRRWYRYTVEVTQNNKCVVNIDGSRVAEFDSDLGRSWLRGRLGLAHWRNSIEFRNVRIETRGPA